MGEIHDPPEAHHTRGPLVGNRRLGELLLGDGIITLDQLSYALERQVIQGGRLGTNLVESFQLDLDVIANELAAQHMLPATLGAHFDNADATIQRRFDPALAHEYKAIPIGRVAPDKVAVACMDPLDAAAITVISRAIGHDVVIAIAPELRIRYQLEQVYDVRRTARFMRVRSDPELRAPEAEPDPAKLEQRKKRRYVQTLSDLPAIEEPSLEEEPDDLSGEGTNLARIALKKVEADCASTGSRLEDDLRAIRRAGSRDAIAEAVLAAIYEGIDGLVDAAILLIIRRDVAIPWKGFIRGRDGAVVDKIVVPLDQPSILAEAATRAEPVCHKDGVSRHPTEIERRMWAMLGLRTPASAAALPVAIDEQIVGLVYVQSASAGLDRQVSGGLAELVKAMTRSFKRLIEAARR